MIDQGLIDALISKPPVIPVGYMLLVYVPDPEEKSEGGIIIQTESQRGLEKKGSAHGFIIAEGSEAWHELGEAWAQVGDHVIFERYAGITVPVEGLDDGSFRLMNDKEVRAIWPS